MKFDADKEQLSSILDWAEKRLEELQVPPKLILSMRLVIEEVVVNIIDYSGSGHLTLDIEKKGDLLTMVFTDQGMAFHPLKQKKPKAELTSLEAIQPGGLGIHIVEHLVDSIDYSRTNDYNRLTITKRCAGF